MRSIRFERLELRPGARVLDLGSGGGRHSFAAMKIGAKAVSVDLVYDDVAQVRGFAVDLSGLSEYSGRPIPLAVVSDARCLPFPDRSFDAVICSEVLEHIYEDEVVLAELARVAKEDVVVAVSVPSCFPEVVNWIISKEYHAALRGHIRIFQRRGLVSKMSRVGLGEISSHRAHAFHSPYWWLKSWVGVNVIDHRLIRIYERFLVKLMGEDHPVFTLLERVADPVLGKSLVVYGRRPPNTSWTTGLP